MAELKEEEVVGAVSGTVKELENFVDEKDLTVKQLQQVLKDEKSAQDRETAKEILKEKINELKVEKDVKRAENDLEDVKKVIGKLEEQHLDGKEFQFHEETVDEMTIVDLIEGPSSDLKTFVEERDFSQESMKELLEAETRAKDRKNVKRFLKSRIKQKQLYRDLQDAREYVEKIEEDFQDIGASSDYLSPDLMEVDNEEEQQKSNGEEEQVNNQENGSEQTERNKEQDEMHEEVRDKESEREEDNIGQESDFKREETIDMLKEYGYNTEELSEKSSEELKEMNKKLRQKQEILEELHTELTNEQLKEISLKELQRLEKEKNQREELIEYLKQAGLDEEKLEQSTIEDLKKIKREIEKPDEENSDGKSKEKIQEEAQEDLEMLKGAVKHPENQEKHKESMTEKLEHAKEKIEKFIEKPEEEKEKGIDEDKVLEMLRRYEELEGIDEKAIKTAHIMKGYLEQRTGVQRELTYEELADSLESVEDDENVAIIRSFFREMGSDQYLEKITIKNIDEVLEASKNAVKELK